MLRILKRSTANPAAFDDIDSPEGTLNKDDGPMDQIRVLRQWPQQRGAMLRILKRSSIIPVDFDAIDSPDGTLNKDDDPVDQIRWEFFSKSCFLNYVISCKKARCLNFLLTLIDAGFLVS